MVGSGRQAPTDRWRIFDAPVLSKRFSMLRGHRGAGRRCAVLGGPARSSGSRCAVRGAPEQAHGWSSLARAVPRGGASVRARDLDAVSSSHPGARSPTHVDRIDRGRHRGELRGGGSACVRAESCHCSPPRWRALEPPNDRSRRGRTRGARWRTGQVRQPTVSSPMSGAAAPFPPGKDRRTNRAVVGANWNWSTPDGVAGAAVATTCQLLPSVEVSRL
jgi:hypothetical protein